jgi:hypothetical protein
MTSWIRRVAVFVLLLLDLAFAQAQLHHFKVELAGGGTIGTQRAGIPFSLRITAQQSNNTTYTAFTGKAKISSTGTLSAGGTRQRSSLQAFWPRTASPSGQPAQARSAQRMS